MITLARGLAAEHEVTIAALAGCAVLREADRFGLAVRAIDPGDENGLRRWFARARFDLVHVHAGIGWEGHTVTRAARRAGTAVVRTEHLPYLLTDDAQRAEHRDEANAIDRMLCVSQAVADSHLAAGIEGHRLAVVLNGVEPAAPPERARETMRTRLMLGDAPVLLMVGRLEPQKAHAALLDAMMGVLARYPDATLLIAGDGSLRIPLARRIDALGLAASVRLLGHVGDIASLMAAADLFVSTSLFEGLPLAVLEAMASGVAVVATEAPGIGEVIEHGRTGWISRAHDAAGLSEAICAALDDPAGCQSVGQAAQAEWDQRYRASRMVSDTTKLYRSVVSDITRQGARRMSPTRIGFIGAGGIAHRHFGVLEHFDDVAIVAVCDSDPARAAEAAQRFEAQSFASADEMLNAVEVDAVFICVPPFAHGAPERAVLERGLPFFVEKPVALDLTVATAIAEQVAERGVVTAVGYHWRYLDTVDEVRGLLSHTPARLVSGYWLDSTPPPQWWWRQEQSGGQMVEQTTHLLDLSRYLLGDVTRVYGLAGHTERAEFPGLDVATVSTASLQFASGAVGNFASTCLLGWNHRAGLHLFGERLAIELTDHDVMIDTGHGRPVRGNGSDPVWHEDRDFIDAVRGGENRIRCDYADAVETHRLALAIGESARTGQSIDLTAATVREPAHV